MSFTIPRKKRILHHLAVFEVASLAARLCSRATGSCPSRRDALDRTERSDEMLGACQDLRWGCNGPVELEGWKLGPEGRAKSPCDTGCDWLGLSMSHREGVNWTRQIQRNVQET